MTTAPRRGFGSIEERGKSYRARYKRYGAWHYVPHHFATKAAARQWLDAEKYTIDMAALGRGEWTPPARRAEEEQQQRKQSLRTVGTWLNEYHDILERPPHNVRRSTLQTYRQTARNRILDPLEPGDEYPAITGLRDIPIHELTKQQVYEWSDALAQAYDTPETNKKAYGRLKAAMSEAVRREYITANPVDVRGAGKKVKAKEKYLPKDEELHAIVQHMPDRYRALTVLMLFHGLRIGEALALQQRNIITRRVDGEHAPRVWVEVEHNVQRLQDDQGRTYMNLQPPKSDASYRQVPVMPALAPIILEHLEVHAPTTSTQVRSDDGVKELLLFTATNKGGVLMDTSYRSVLQRAKTKAGVNPDIDPHCGRNWLITRLAEQGAHLKEIGRLLGQSDLDTIMDVYLKVRAERTDSLMLAVNGSIEDAGSGVTDLGAARREREGA